MRVNKFFEFKESDFDALDSFKMHEQLSDIVWDNEEIKDDIRKGLIDISNEFWKEIDLEIELKDIYLTGSLVTYGYSKYSDYDLHLVVDFNESTDPDMTKRYCDQFRFNWNTKHNILLKGLEVELYVQDINEPHTSIGLYSLMNNKWIRKPSVDNIEPDTDVIRQKSETIMSQIDNLEIELDGVDNKSTLESYADEIWTKITKGRKSGLEKGGEYSIENLVFKFLRRNGYIKILSDIRLKIYDSKYSD